MGVGMGYAIATAVETGKPVIALEGDSAFGFDGMEMETICRYHLPVIVVVVNNGGIYNGDVNVVPDQPGPTVLDHDAHYGDIAKAFGGDSYRVNNYTEMKDALEKHTNQATQQLLMLKSQHQWVKNQVTLAT